jgi:hypothetical protein
MRDNNASLAHAIRGPVTLITIGALFALNNFTPYRFSQTWPVLLIVFGLLSLLGRSVEPAPPAAPPPIYYPPAPPPPPGPGTYRQTQFPGTPDSPASGTAAKGGFGTSAPARQETGQASGDSV